MIHPRQADLVAAAQSRILRHMHSMDPTTSASAEMSRLKADGPFGTALEEVLRAAITRFDAAPLIAEALEALGHSDGAGDG